MKDVYSSDTQKSPAEVTGNTAEHLQEGRMHDYRGNFCINCKEPHKTGDEKICEKYKMEATTKNKMRLDKYDAYTAKETLGYRGRKSYVSVARGAAKRE